jgi:hypothetical protein
MHRKRQRNYKDKKTLFNKGLDNFSSQTKKLLKITRLKYRNSKFYRIKDLKLKRMYLIELLLRKISEFKNLKNK